MWFFIIFSQINKILGIVLCLFFTVAKSSKTNLCCRFFMITLPWNAAAINRKNIQLLKKKQPPVTLRKILMFLKTKWLLESKPKMRVWAKRIACKWWNWCARPELKLESRPDYGMLRMFLHLPSLGVKHPISCTGTPQPSAWNHLLVTPRTVLHQCCAFLPFTNDLPLLFLM